MAIDPMNIYQIGIDYPLAKQKELKKFCSVIGTPIRRFVAEAIDNEIEARFYAMTEAERAAAKLMVSKM